MMLVIRLQINKSVRPVERWGHAITTIVREAMIGSGQVLFVMALNRFNHCV